jgi:hypothetical protein
MISAPVRCFNGHRLARRTIVAGPGGQRAAPAEQDGTEAYHRKVLA